VVNKDYKKLQAINTKISVQTQMKQKRQGKTQPARKTPSCLELKAQTKK